MDGLVDFESAQFSIAFAVSWELSEQHEIQPIQSGKTLDPIVRSILEEGFNMYLISYIIWIGSN